MGKSEIQDDFVPLIEQVAQLLRNNPNKKINIVGHTDSKGSDAVNNALSLRRARALATTFAKLGVNKNQIMKIEGRGEKELLYPKELDEYEKQGNRRVDIILI